MLLQLFGKLLVSNLKGLNIIAILVFKRIFSLHCPMFSVSWFCLPNLLMNSTIVGCKMFFYHSCNESRWKETSAD